MFPKRCSRRHLYILISKIFRVQQYVQILRGTKSGRAIFELGGKIPQNSVFRNDGDASGGGALKEQLYIDLCLTSLARIKAKTRRVAQAS